MSFKNTESNFKTVVVIGATGFIGGRLIKELSANSSFDVRVLMRGNNEQTENYTNIKFIKGDLLDRDSLDNLLIKDSIVINLAYLPSHNIEAISNLAEACIKKQVSRLVHCSTAVVVGRTKEICIDETARCEPVSEYEHTKLQMEEVLLEKGHGKFEVTILRPTAVFGPGGKNLLKLACQLTTGNKLANYFRSSVFNRRSMNLVCVENVVAALMFLIQTANVDHEIFIITDDNSPTNNYRDIEDRLNIYFENSYPIPRVFFPQFMLAVLLRLAGKSNINPSAKFCDLKLKNKGFEKPQCLNEAVDRFAEWYKGSYKK